jgi:hypothetical protein
MPGLASLGSFLQIAVPLFAALSVWWLIQRTDRVMTYLFPDLEWEHSLGWLNIRAQRRAGKALRWLGYFVYLLLAGALLGIVWATRGLRDLADQGLDAYTVGDVMLYVPVLLGGLGSWFLYLGCGLLPNLRRQRERDEWEGLKRFRAEMAEKERERERQAPSRVQFPLQKPRVNLEAKMIVPDRGRRRRGLGEGG